MTTTVRSVDVHLNAHVDAYIAKMRTAGHATNQAFDRAQVGIQATNRELETSEKRLAGVDARAVTLGRDVRSLSGDMRGFDRDTGRANATIDKLSGRLRIFAELAAILGPGVVPLGAAAGVGVGALASQLTIAAIAGGSAIVAFQGVGDAVKALSEYKLDPTVENLEKAQETLTRLGPDAASFVLEFQEFIPVLREIRDAAAAGWFPGLEGSLEHFEDLAPSVIRLFEGIGRAGGEAVEAGAESLAGERWEDFFDFLATEAPDVVTELAGIVGDLTHGATEMWQAFDPGNDAFLAWVGDVADGFDQWASSSEGREDITAFLDYARETGPDVAELFSSLVTMLVRVTQAAAPLGGPVLDGLTAVADVLGAIAGSDLGTPIFAGLAAMSLLSRATDLWGKVSTTSAGAFVSGQVRASAGVRTLGADLRSMRGEYGRANAAQAVMLSGLSKTTAAAGRTRSTLSGLGKSAGVVGGLALATSGLADGIGLTNSMSLGLMGTMLGPWGAALGAGAGFVLDVKSASDEAGDSIDRWTAALDENAQSFSGQRAVLAGAAEELAAFRDDIDSDSLGEGIRNTFDPHVIAEWTKEAWGAQTGVEEQEAALARMRREVELNETAVIKLGQAMGTDVRESIFGGVIDEKVIELLERAQPAMDALGYTVEDLYAAASNQRPGSVWAPFVDEGELDRMNAEIAAMTTHMDSAEGRTEAVADAIAGLGDDVENTTTKAEALQGALDALLGPNLNLSAATDAWDTALKRLNEDLSEHGNRLVGNSQAAKENREVIRGRIVDLTDMLTAEAEAGAGPIRLARLLRNQREALLDAGEAAGLSRPKLAAYLKQMGLTPALIRTTFEALGIDEATVKARRAREAFFALPKDVRTRIKTDGVPETKAEIDALVAKYKLTEKERRALISLKDNASGAAAVINRILDNAARDRSSTIRVGYVVDRSGMRGMGGPTTTSAMGDIFDGHQPQIARGGHTRIWAEPETGGEAYIPLRNDHRRPRAKSILEQTASEMGGAVSWFARGAVVNGTHARSNGSQWYSPGAHDIDLAGMVEELGGLTEGLAGISRAELARRRAELAMSERIFEREAKHREDRIAKEVAADKARLDAMVQSQRDFSEQVSSLYRSDVFGQKATPMEVPDNFADLSPEQQRAFLESQAQIQSEQTTTMQQNAITGDISRAREALRLYWQLRDKGFDGPAFREMAAKGDVETLRAWAAMPASQLQVLEAQYELRDSLANRAGQYAGGAEFGQVVRGLRSDYRESVKEQRQMKLENRLLRQEFVQLREELKPAARVAGKAFGQEIKHELATGDRG